MEELFDTRKKRAVGWVVVLLLFISWGGSLWHAGPRFKKIEPTPDSLRELAALPSEEYADWLTNFSGKHVQPGISWQALIVQAIPNEVPIVLATARGSSDDEGAVNWRCPWEAVNETLRDPLLQPTLVEGTYAEVNYQHLLIPIDETGKRCVLVNQMAPKPSILSYRTALLVAATLLGLTVFVAGFQ